MRRSPRWSAGIKRIVLVMIIIGFVYVLYLARILILPILMSMVLAYILQPVVHVLHWRLRLPRTLAIAIVYIVLAGVLVAIPAVFVSPFVRQVNWFIDNIPSFIEQGRVMAEQPIELIGGQQVKLTDVVPLENLFDSMLSLVPSVGFTSVNIFGSVATITLLTVGWVLFTLFVSFYFLKDYEMLFRGLVGFVPEEYEWEMYQLGYEISRVWNAFLRGQLVLFAVLGSVVFIFATIIGLPNALLIGVIAGFSEFLPQIGPTVVIIPATLIAFFQHDQSWLGSQMSPIGFALLVGGVYLLINNLASYFLTPRVLGRSLNLHPVVVFCAALAGAAIAGILGILLASPMLASIRVILRYLYCKLRDIPPYPDPLENEPQIILTTPSATDENESSTVISGGAAPPQSAGVG